MPNYDFKKDLPIAKKTEKEVARLLENIYDAEILEDENPTKAYDILAIIKGKTYTFEVKEDFTCEKTGNVGMEFSCRGKPSGIQVTGAIFYIYKIHTDHGIYFWLYTTSRLRQMVKNGEYFRIVNGGDKGSNSLNYLFRYNIFIRHGCLLTPKEETLQIAS
jgi:hypothetical protein